MHWYACQPFHDSGSLQLGIGCDYPCLPVIANLLGIRSANFQGAFAGFRAWLLIFGNGKWGHFDGRLQLKPK